MSSRKLFSLILLLVLIVAGTAVVGKYADRGRAPEVPVPVSPVAEGEVPDCVPMSLAGQPLVNGLGDVVVAAFPGSRRLSYADNGSSQYVAKAAPADVREFYEDRMRAGCWQVTAQRHNEVLYAKDDAAVRLALLENQVSGKVIIDYRAGVAGEVLGDSSVFMAQTTCPSDQVSCTSSMGGSWCQMPPCPTETPPPSSTPPPSTTSCSGSYQQSGSTYPSCNYSTCPNGCTWDSQGCPNGCTSSSTPPPSSGSGTCTGGQVWCTSSSGYGGWCQMPPCPSSTPPSSTTCSGAYQQSGSTYPNCNYSACPSGCTWGADGCPSGCYAPPSSGSCPSGQQWCSSSNSCVASGSPCGGSTSACPSGQYWCSSTNSCKPTSDTYCPPSGGGGSACPSGQYWCNGACVSTSTSCSSYTSCSSTQYWCNGACISMGSYCAPSGGSETQTSCTAASGLWCQPTISPHCHYGPNPSPCEADTPYVSSCPSGQYMCNGACISNTSSCSPSTWPSDQSSCTASGKYWCTPQSGGAGWCQYSACGSTTSTPSCTGGTYYCPSSNSCVPSGSSCGSTTTNTFCPSGQYWCPSNNSCVSNATPCGAPSPIPAPQPIVKCGQCQVAQGSSCVQAPVGTPDPLCNGGQCDMYGGCVQLSGGKKLVGRGAICGDNWCNVEKGENKENCPSDGCTNASAQTVQPTQTNTVTQPITYPPYQQQHPGQTVYPQGPYGPQDQYGPQGPQYQGPSEEDIERMRREQFKMMKQGMRQFTRGVTQMQRFVTRLEARLKRQGIGIPAELKNALAAAPALIKKFEAADTFEEVEGLMEDMQDIGMVMQEWGPRLGELEGLSQMLRDADRQTRQMYSAFKRIERQAKRNEQLVDDIKRLEAMLGVMSRQVKDAKELAKTDPEAAMDLIKDFYANVEEYWSAQSLIEMMTNLRRGLSQANTELTRAKQRVRTLERKKDADRALVAEAKELLAQIGETIPELRALVNRKDADLEEVKEQAESFWQLIEEFENLMAVAGEHVYAPKVRQGQGFDAEIPEGFIMPQSQIPVGPFEGGMGSEGFPGGFSGDIGPGGYPGGYPSGGFGTGFGAPGGFDTGGGFPGSASTPLPIGTPTP